MLNMQLHLYSTIVIFYDFHFKLFILETAVIMFEFNPKMTKMHFENISVLLGYPSDHKR